MHPAHGIAEHQPQPPHSEPFRNKTVLGRHHVVVIVAWEGGAQPIRRLGGPAGSQGIRQDDIMPRGVQRLARTKKLPAELR